MSSFLWVRCPEAATWQRVKEMAKRHPHKWDMEADGTLIAVLFTAVEVLPRCYIEVRDTFHGEAAGTNRHLLKKSCGQYLWPEKIFGGISGRVVFLVDRINIFPLSWARLHLGWFHTDIRGWKRSGRKAIHRKRSATTINISLCLHWITWYGFTRDGDHSGSFHQQNADRSQLETVYGAKTA